jgi:hypothetical protein
MTVHRRASDAMLVCGFCDNTDITQEHVWANWLRQIIIESRAEGGMKIFRAEIARAGKTISFPKNDLEITVGMPCGSCNNGWMSDLENAVRPFMTDMVSRGEKVLLDDDRQRALIHWTVKTAMVYEFTGRGDESKYFRQEERREFKNSRALPSNVWIWLGRYDDVLPVHALQLRGNVNDTAPTVYSLTFTANFLAIQIFAYRESADALGRYPSATRSERIVQVYPLPGAWINWPPPTTIDDDALQVLDYRFQNVISRK